VYILTFLPMKTNWKLTSHHTN